MTFENRLARVPMRPHALAGHPVVAARTPAGWLLAFAAVAAGAWLCTNAHAAAPKPAGCLIEPSAVAEVGSPVTGVIDKLHVNLGDSVEVGQVLAWLRSDVERANAEVASTRAQVDADVRAAEATVELSSQKVARLQQLATQNFVSQQAVDQARAEAEVAAQKLRMARSQQAIWSRERAAAQAQVGIRTLRSPISGVVVERYINPGERVEERPVLRVATIDPLRVDLMVPAAQWGAVSVGDSITIRPDLPNTAPASARVSYVDRIMDAASNTFRVRLMLPNPGNRLPAGLRCKADLAVAAASAKSPAAPSNAAPASSPAALAPAAPAKPVAAKPIAAPVPVAAPASVPVVVKQAAVAAQPQAKPAAAPKTQAGITQTLNLSAAAVVPVPQAATQPPEAIPVLKLKASQKIGDSKPPELPTPGTPDIDLKTSHSLRLRT